MEMQAVSGGWSIGRLARASGLPVRTVRFYSDAGLLPPRRTSAGHRRHDPTDLARLQLIRSLRSLDVDIPAIRDVLADAAGLQEVLRAHTRTLEVRMHALRRQLAVVRAAADAPTERALARVHALTRIEAAERDRLLEGFWDRVLPATADGDAAWFRAMGHPELPADPTGRQLDAWLELAELAADPGFRAVTEANAAWFGSHTRPGFDPVAWARRLDRALDLAREAAAAGAGPGDPRTRGAVDAFVGAYADAFAARDPAPAFRRWLSEQLAGLTDPRAERWWHLVAQVAPPADAPERDAATVTWVHRALAETVRHP